MIPVSLFANQQQEAQELLDILSEQLKYRNNIEQHSFEITKTLCDVFELRKKYGMSLRPDPVTETWTRMAHFNTPDSVAYRNSLLEWVSVGNEGVLTNWGLDGSASAEDANILIISKSRFTKTLVVTKGFFEASKTCGELDAAALKKFLFEQELAQTGLSFIVVPAVLVKGIMKAGKVSWPLIRKTFIGSVAAKLPWSKIGKVSAGALIGFVLYTAAYDYLTFDDVQVTGSEETKKSFDDIKERNVQEALKVWTTYQNKKNDKFKSAEDYLLERKSYVNELQEKYHSELSQIGEEKLKLIVDRHVEGEQLQIEEFQIYMKAVYYSAAKLFLSQNP